MTRRLLRSLPLVAAVAGVTLLAAPVAAQTATASRVSIATPSATTPENHQNEPALAVDAHSPNVLVSGLGTLVVAMVLSQTGRTCLPGEGIRRLPVSQRFEKRSSQATGFSHRPVSAERTIASITAMFAMASSSGTGT